MSPKTSSGDYQKAIALFDSYHREDPNTEIVDGKEFPAELLYAERMSECLARFAPDAGEAVKLAARCQHIGRWEIPRNQYPMDRKGYLRWRTDEKIHHARIADKILKECGYDDGTIEKVNTLLLKKELTTNSDTQLLEDVACLVFLQFYFEDFAARHEDEKIVEILRKTLRKMSQRAKGDAARIKLSQKNRLLLERAMEGS
jgi:hypothetical protein